MLNEIHNKKAVKIIGHTMLTIAIDIFVLIIYAFAMPKKSMNVV